uniref:Uncharacterized protein n=1 Tax=Tanacetum cinerariifolium TaxID=118510 RepID=A0A699JVP4_TANCI|nr:hypothetical protein [Tanacetum cinerariifolium]
MLKFRVCVLGLFSDLVSSEVRVQVKFSSVIVSLGEAYISAQKWVATRVIHNETRWANHGKPPGADVAGIADAASIMQQVIFTKKAQGAHMFLEGVHICSNELDEKVKSAHMFLKGVHIRFNKFDEKAHRAHMFLEDGHICRWLNPMKDDERR